MLDARAEDGFLFFLDACWEDLVFIDEKVDDKSSTELTDELSPKCLLLPTDESEEYSSVALVPVHQRRDAFLVRAVMTDRYHTTIKSDSLMVPYSLLAVAFFL